MLIKIIWIVIGQFIKVIFFKFQKERAESMLNYIMHVKGKGNTAFIQNIFLL